MRFLICRQSALIIILVVALAAPAGTTSQRNPPQRTFQQHLQLVTSGNKQFEDVFGPAPALAATPFLGLATITGAALLVDQPFVAQSDSAFLQRLRNNTVLREAKPYASWWLFAVLVLLALATAIVNSGKLQGSFGKFAHVAEMVAAGGAYLAIAAIALASHPSQSAVVTQPRVVIASVLPAFDFGAVTLFITAGLAVTAMMIVRLAFDLLIWLNPIPFVDMLFQGLKTIFSLTFMVVYFWNPPVAALWAAVILFPCLLLLPWAFRLLSFARRIVIYPLLGRVFPAFKAQLIDPSLARSTETSPTLACHGSVLRARGLKKRQAVAFIQVPGRTTILPIRGRRKARVLAAAGEEVVIGRAVAWIEVRIIGLKGQILDQIALPYCFAPRYGELCTLLSAHDEGYFGTRKALRALGRATTLAIEAANRSVSTWKSEL
jgi:hypothetical protein